jgi:hypothetical protein
MALADRWVPIMAVVLAAQVLDKWLTQVEPVVCKVLARLREPVVVSVALAVEG